MVKQIFGNIEDRAGGFPGDFRSQAYQDGLGFAGARRLVQHEMIRNPPQVNRVDYSSYLRGGNTQIREQHVYSQPEVIQTTTNHYESNVRPVVVQQERQVLQQPPMIAHTTSNTYQVPAQVTSTETRAFTSSYQPFNYGGSTTSGNKNTKYMFNYQAPKEYFHPDMTYNRV